MASSDRIARGPLKLYVRPVRSATAMVDVRPGSIPKISPVKTDRTRARIPCGVRAIANASPIYLNAFITHLLMA